MTAQIPDSFQYRDQDYSLAGINGGKLFEPEKHGLRPIESCTACYHGFVCSYALFEDHLVLDNLSVTLSHPAPVLFGVKPSKPKSEHSIWDAFYIDLKHPVKFTGGLLIATGFIQELYVHMGFHPAWKYEEVYELIFEDGTLKDAFDRSEYMADFRKRREAAIDAAPDERREPTKAEVGDWIERCFSLEYHGLF